MKQLVLCNYVQVLFINGHHSYLVWVQDLQGITALETQLPSDTVYVPALPTMWISAVDALIRFNQRRYTFPEHNHNILVIATDALAADAFLTYIEGKLCIPKAQFNKPSAMCAKMIFLRRMSGQFRAAIAHFIRSVYLLEKVPILYRVLDAVRLL